MVEASTIVDKEEPSLIEVQNDQNNQRSLKEEPQKKNTNRAQP